MVAKTGQLEFTIDRSQSPAWGKLVFIWSVIVSGDGSAYIARRESLDKTGATSALHQSRIASNRLGR